jgi:hemoglobin-like flavoprotein
MKTPASSREKKRPAARPLTARERELVRRSFKQIEPQGDIAALAFYRNLFTAAPSLRPLFHTSIELQGRKFMEALSYTVAALDDPDALMPALEAMGRRHVAYGVKEEHYGPVVQVLLATLKETGGDAFTREVHEAWRRALEFVADAMKRGATAATANA